MVNKGFGLLGDSCPEEPNLSVLDRLTLATQWTSPCKALENEVRRRANSHLRPQIIVLYACFVGVDACCDVSLFVLLLQIYMTTIANEYCVLFASVLDAKSDREMARTTVTYSSAAYSSVTCCCLCDMIHYVPYCQI